MAVGNNLISFMDLNEDGSLRSLRQRKKNACGGDARPSSGWLGRTHMATTRFFKMSTPA